MAGGPHLKHISEQVSLLYSKAIEVLQFIFRKKRLPCPLLQPTENRRYLAARLCQRTPTYFKLLALWALVLNTRHLHSGDSCTAYEGSQALGQEQLRTPSPGRLLLLIRQSSPSVALSCFL